MENKINLLNSVNEDILTCNEMIEVKAGEGGGGVTTCGFFGCSCCCCGPCNNSKADVKKHKCRCSDRVSPNTNPTGTA